MNAKAETRSISMEYDLPHPAAKVWRALTDPELLAAWLMVNDMRPLVGTASPSQAAAIATGTTRIQGKRSTTVVAIAEPSRARLLPVSHPACDVEVRGSQSRPAPVRDRSLGVEHGAIPFEHTDTGGQEGTVAGGAEPVHEGEIAGARHQERM